MQIDPYDELGISKRRRRLRRREAALRTTAQNIQNAYEAGRQSTLPATALPAPTYTPSVPVFPSSATTFDPSAPPAATESGDFYAEQSPPGLPAYIQTGTTYSTEESTPAAGGAGWLIPAALLFMAFS